MKVEPNKRSLLHYWEPLSSAIRFGHISLELCNLYVSFWPEKGTTSCQILNDNKCPARWYNTIEEEIKENGKLVPISLAVYDLDVIAVKSWLVKFKLTDPKYDVREQNCASVVYKALKAGHSWFDKNVKDCCGIKTPKQVFEYVKKGYNTNTTIGGGYLCSHCLYLLPYKGFGDISYYFYSLYMQISRKVRKEIKRETNDHLLELTKSESVVETNNAGVQEEEKPVQTEELDVIDLRCKRAQKVVSLSKKTFIYLSNEDFPIVVSKENYLKDQSKEGLLKDSFKDEFPKRTCKIVVTTEPVNEDFLKEPVRKDSPIEASEDELSFEADNISVIDLGINFRKVASNENDSETLLDFVNVHHQNRLRRKSV